MMSDSTFHLFFQTVSLLGVAGGLIYTGVQLHNWRNAQYVTNFTKLVELQMQLRKMVADDPTLAGASLGPGIEVSPEEIRGDFYNLMQVSLFEIAWFSHRHGQLTEDYFKNLDRLYEDSRRAPGISRNVEDRSCLIRDELGPRVRDR